MYISINGLLVDKNNGAVSPISEGFLYGYGAFETIKFNKDKIYFLEEHYERLSRACNELDIPLEYNLSRVEGYCRELIENSNIESGALKILHAKNIDEKYLVLTLRENKYDSRDYIRGFKLNFTNVKRNPLSPLTYIKSNNYMENLIVRQQVLQRGYDEAILENFYGKICEGTLSNLFFVKGEKVHTPHISCGLLPGIMRNKVLEICAKKGCSVEMGEFTRGDLLESDEIFITNSLLEIMPVFLLENKTFDKNNNKITKELMQTLKKHID